MDDTDAVPEDQDQTRDRRAPVTVERAPEAAGSAAAEGLPAAQSPPAPPARGEVPAAGTPPAPRAAGWTPEQYVQAFKELVTAILALLLVGYTVGLARTTLGFIGDTEKVADAKDVLLLMLGLAGVVVGYYFGRVPADAQATQAQKRAAAATAQSEQVSAQAEQAAEQANRLVTRLATTGAVRRDASGGIDPALNREIEQLQSSLQQLSRRAQTRYD